MIYKELIDSVITERGFVTDFSQEEQQAAEQAAKNIAPTDDYIDCRSREFITIDGDTAYDFDDAVSCRRGENGNIILTVAIADVSAYVQHDSLLDHAARQRGNSVYLPDRVIPMLPNVLSGEACSLLPEQERLCLCCESDISSDGTIMRYQFFRAVIRSAKRMTYDEASAIMHGDISCDYTTPALLWELAQQLRAQRIARGGMLLERPEKYCTVSKDNKLQVGSTRRDIAHWAIEEAMIIANRCAADLLIQRQYPALHRIHNKPSADKIKQLTQILSSIGIALPHTYTAADFAAILNTAEERDPDLASALTPLVLGTLSRAEYTLDEKTGHFGLACPCYTHFTSPIRRYPDLLIHRLLIAAIAKKPPPIGADELAAIGSHCSESEVRADKAGWDSNQRLLCVSAQAMVGCEYTGYVSGVAGMGFFVTVGELGIDGLVRFSTLAGYWRRSEKEDGMIYSDANNIIRIGDKIDVQLISVVPEKGRVDFAAAQYRKK